MSEQSALIVDVARRAFAEFGEPLQMRAHSELRTQLWRALEESGLTLTWVDETLGGAGATLTDGFEVLKMSGKYAANIALAETLLAGWLLQHGRIPAPRGIMTLAPVDVRDTVSIGANGKCSGMARAVPFAREAAHIVVVASSSDNAVVALTERKRCEVGEKTNLAGDARDTVSWKSVTPLAVAELPLSFEDVYLMGAVARAMQMAGALESILDMSVAYANERVAFERPIGKFQAIQHSLARLASETAAALAAAGSAADAIQSSLDSTIGFDAGVFLEAASAKIRVGEAVATGAAIAHQVHGALGFSEEHVLHCYTQRLLAWRDDFGNESRWALALGRHVAKAGSDQLWPALTAR